MEKIYRPIQRQAFRPQLCSESARLGRYKRNQMGNSGKKLMRAPPPFGYVLFLASRKQSGEGEGIQMSQRQWLDKGKTGEKEAA